MANLASTIGASSAQASSRRTASSRVNLSQRVEPIEERDASGSGSESEAFVQEPSVQGRSAESTSRAQPQDTSAVEDANQPVQYDDVAPPTSNRPAANIGANTARPFTNGADQKAIPKASKSTPEKPASSSSAAKESVQSGQVTRFLKKRFVWMAIAAIGGPLLLPVGAVIIAVLAVPILVCYVGGEALGTDAFAGVCVDALSPSN